MTPSIIRRFARYHGIKLIKPGEPMYCHEPAQLAEAIYGRLEWGESVRARDKIVQSLTRIEDAEMLMGRVTEASKTLAYPGMDDNIVASTVRDFYVFDVDRLLVLAGVNPAKWREVRDEEA